MTHALQSFQGSNDQATQTISSASDCRQQPLTGEDALRRQTLKALSLGLFGSAGLGLSDATHAQAYTIPQIREFLKKPEIWAFQSHRHIVELYVNERYK